MYLNTVDNEGNQNSNHLVHKPVSTSVEKTASACMGAVLTMTLTNPLDVVKTRHQEKTTTGNRAYKGTRDAFSKILKSEGPFALWRGLAPGLMMALPSTAIYFVGYDYIRDQTSTRFSGTLIDSYSPLWAGGLARTISALVVSPLELLRTRMQSADGVHGFKGVMRGIKIMVEREGPKALWRGLIPTMMRDVPFSAVYWTGYERIKQDLSLYTNMTHFQISFASGASSGMIAAFITTPFDVIKTQRQVSTDIEGIVPTE
ncbi:mitochondrial carrier domain-containing protein [Pilobolus umbonatus]|nr:mitochondrial carrier domain-containing protein [Pilobolus umbonatus]